MYIRCMENCVHYVYGLSGFAKNVKYSELRKFDRKLCTLDVWIFWIYRKFNIQNCVNWTGNCVYFVYRLSGFAKNLKFQNCVNLTGNCVH